jgi:hypothetical protein
VPSPVPVAARDEIRLEDTMTFPIDRRSLFAPVGSIALAATPATCVLAMRCLMLAASIFAAVPSLAGVARAQEVTQSGWQFFVTPYIWTTGLSGTFGANTPNAPTQRVTAGIGDVLGHLSNIPIMASVEIRNDRFGLLSDLMVVSLRTPVSTPGPYFSGVTAQTTQFVTTELGTYRVVQWDRQWLDVGIGVRTAAVWTRLTFNAGLAPGFTTSSSIAWAVPLFGARYHVNITDRIGLTSYADVGEAGGSTLTWEMLGMADYRFNDWLMFHAGYRHLHLDWSGSAVRGNVALSGPFLSATFQF